MVIDMLVNATRAARIKARKRLVRADADLLQKPLPFQPPPLVLGDRVSAVDRQQVIQERADGDEPAVLLRESFHERLEPRFDASVLGEPAGEMGIHDAGPAFLFQAILGGFGEAPLNRSIRLPSEEANQ